MLLRDILYSGGRFFKLPFPASHGELVSLCRGRSAVRVQPLQWVVRDGVASAVVWLLQLNTLVANHQATKHFVVVVVAVAETIVSVPVASEVAVAADIVAAAATVAAVAGLQSQQDYPLVFPISLNLLCTHQAASELLWPLPTF